MKKIKAGFIVLGLIFSITLTFLGCMLKKTDVKDKVIVSPKEEVLVVPKDRNVFIPGERVLEIPGEGERKGVIIEKK